MSAEFRIEEHIEGGLVEDSIEPEQQSSESLIEQFPDPDLQQAVNGLSAYIIQAEELSGSGEDEYSQGHDLELSITDDDPDIESLTHFLNSAGQIPLLTREEERALAKRIEEGDRQAHQELVAANIRLAVSLAKGYAGHGVELDDLIQEGITGVMIAADKFDYRKGYKFSTYASWWIRQSVSRGIADTSRTIRNPIHRDIQLRKISRSKKKFFAQNGREPTIEELVDATEYAMHLVQKIIDEQQSVLQQFSLEALVNPSDGDDGDTFHKFIADKNTAEFDLEVERRMLSDKIATVVDTLPPIQQKIIELRYGLNGYNPHTLIKTAEKLGFSIDYIRNRQRSAEDTLRSSQELKEML